MQLIRFTRELFYAYMYVLPKVDSNNFLNSVKNLFEIQFKYISL